MDKETRETKVDELIQLQQELEEHEELAEIIREERNLLLREIFHDNPETFVAGGYRFTRSVRIAYDLDKFAESDPLTAENIKTTRKLLKSMESIWKDTAKEKAIGTTASETYSATRVA